MVGSTKLWGWLDLCQDTMHLVGALQPLGDENTSVEICAPYTQREHRQGALFSGNTSLELCSREHILVQQPILCVLSGFRKVSVARVTLVVW